MTSTILPLFPFLLHQYDLENFDGIQNKLIDYVYKEKEKDPIGRKISNFGGWQSIPQYADFSNPLLHQVLIGVKKIFSSSVLRGEMKITVTDMWININGKGHFNKLHDHPGSHFAGVLWIKSLQNSGKLDFENPFGFSRFHEMKGYTEEFKSSFNCHPAYYLSPKSGKMIIFPSSLNHSVGFNESDEDRISVSFNIIVEE